jgi:hypothetical protein
MIQTQPRKLTILEGPDGAGKTRLAMRIVQKTNARYVHFTPTLGAKGQFLRMHIEAMLPALLGYQDVVMDRAWPSEPIYGAIYREGEDRIDPVGKRMLDRLAARCYTRMVLCLPKLETCLRSFRERKGAGLEYLDSTKQLTDVHGLYERRYEFGQISDLPIEHYDYEETKCDRSIVKVTDSGRVTLRTPWHPVDSTSTGFLDAPIVLISDDHPTLREWDSWYRFSAISADTFCSPWSWLSHLLDSGGIPESKLLWINADDPNLESIIISHARAAIFALGRKTAAMLASTGLVDDHRIRVVKAPHEVWCEGETYTLVSQIRKVLDVERMRQPHATT